MFTIGYGVFTTKTFAAGDILLQYPGELIYKNEAEIRDQRYKENNEGCFLYLFMLGNTQMW